MADSDNTMTLPFVTRGRKTKSAPAAARNKDCRPIAPRAGVSDPALALAKEWVEAHEKTRCLCLRQQQLETQLGNRIGFPTVRAVTSADADPTVRVDPIEEYDDEHLARWLAEDIALGYSATKDAEELAASAEQRLLDDLPMTAAHSIAGVLAKLSIILQVCEDNCDDAGFPGPHIRSALDDLARLTRHAIHENFLSSAEAGAEAR